MIELAKIKWDDLEAYELSESQNLELRNYLLNQNPPASWVKKHPFGGFSYLPIDKVEYLLTKLFKKWYVEVKEVKQIVNAVMVSVRLFYWDNESDCYRHQDGVGAKEFQVNKGAAASDIGAIKANAVPLAVPIAETQAIKDAADKIGRIFGRDISRKDTLTYNIDENKFKNL